MSVSAAKNTEYHFWQAEDTSVEIICLFIMCSATDTPTPSTQIRLWFFSRLTFKEKNVQIIPIFGMQYVLKIYFKSDFLKVKGKNLVCMSVGRGACMCFGGRIKGGQTQTLNSPLLLVSHKMNKSYQPHHMCPCETKRVFVWWVQFFATNCGLS